MFYYLHLNEWKLIVKNIEYDLFTFYMYPLRFKQIDKLLNHRQKYNLNEIQDDKVENIDDGTKYDKHQTKEKLTEIEAFNEIEDINDYLYKFENEETYHCSLCNKEHNFSYSKATIKQNNVNLFLFI